MDGSFQKDAFPVSEESEFTNSCSDEYNYKIAVNNSILSQMCLKVTNDNLEDMKFFCKSYITASRWKKADNKFQFLKMLQTFVDEETFPFFLAELLFTIQRFDLLKKMGICKHIGKHIFEKKSVLDPLKKLLFSILNSLDNDDAKDVASELYHLVGPSKHNKDLSSLFLELSDDENVKSSFLQTLYLKLRNENNAFANKLQAFMNGREEKLIASSCLMSSEQNRSLITSEIRLMSSISIDPAASVASASSISSVPSIMSQLSEDYYDMSCSPCGLCVIINVKDFRPSDIKNPQLTAREGTDIDRDKLKRIFTSFDFSVIVRDNLTCLEIKEFLKDIAKLNHTDYSCFICCILSHGKKGEIAGSDCVFLDIQTDIIYPFSGSNCPTLLGKPKLFFIQACQGHSAMESASSDIEEDGPRSYSQSVCLPDLSDHLLACATVPGFASFRSKSQGSWFIEFLTGQLDLTGHTDDILNVLRDVNRELSRMNTPKCLKDGKIKKQIPYPSYTLTKKLIFRKISEKIPVEN